MIPRLLEVFMLEAPSPLNLDHSDTELAVQALQKAGKENAPIAKRLQSRATLEPRDQKILFHALDDWWPELAEVGDHKWKDVKELTDRLQKGSGKMPGEYDNDGTKPKAWKSKHPTMASTFGTITDHMTTELATLTKMHGGFSFDEARNLYDDLSDKKNKLTRGKDIKPSGPGYPSVPSVDPPEKEKSTWIRNMDNTVGRVVKLIADKVKPGKAKANEKVWMVVPGKTGWKNKSGGFAGDPASGPYVERAKIYNVETGEQKMVASGANSGLQQGWKMMAHQDGEWVMPEDYVKP